ncbi:MAG: ATP-binding cassette domain-containing protein, partial [Magnetococcales bacterium]|nr:ATP-binding cassette domain-containing protein [Magnetococcales bacterium]
RRIFPGMTVFENLIMGTMPLQERLSNGGDHGGSINQADSLDKVFTLFPRLKERERQRAGTLSGGEQQMLAIGRALMSQPELLLLDEPSLGLAPLISKQIFHTLREIAREGATIFLVEQNANQALRLADRGYVMANGVIEMQGTGQELLEAPEVKRAYLGGA